MKVKKYSHLFVFCNYKSNCLSNNHYVRFDQSFIKFAMRHTKYNLDKTNLAPFFPGFVFSLKAYLNINRSRHRTT